LVTGLNTDQVTALDTDHIAALSTAQLAYGFSIDSHDRADQRPDPARSRPRRSPR
jgi:hypothetical protein